jgi:hypothetical protein
VINPNIPHFHFEFAYLNVNMEFKLFSGASSTQKGIMPEGDFDENGINLKLSLAPPSSLDLQLYLKAIPVNVHKCQVCKCTQTPIWRTGPKGTRVRPCTTLHPSFLSTVIEFYFFLFSFLIE